MSTYSQIAIRIIAVGTAFASLAVSTTRANAQGPTAPNGASTPISVFLIDDQTGAELARDHGIQPLSTSDLEVLINAVLKGTTPVRLLHQAVDEDASDNRIGEMDFRPYAGGRPPTPPSPNFPLRQLGEKMKRYRAERANWQQGILAYRNQLVGGVQGFVREVMNTQAAVARKFDEMLAKRNGRDFNRSDIVGSVLAANRALGPEGRRILVLNTDADDQPAKRRPRNTALTVQELNPQVELIWVNTSRLPEQSPLFRGVSNPTRRASSMREAMDLIVSAIDTTDEKKVATAGAAGVTNE
jgi:hypothetical protein